MHPTGKTYKIQSEENTGRNSQQRKQWKDAKILQREKLKQKLQKLHRVREKDQGRKAANRAEKKKHETKLKKMNTTPKSPLGAADDDFPSTSAAYKAVSRARKSLPKKSQRFAADEDFPSTSAAYKAVSRARKSLPKKSQRFAADEDFPSTSAAYKAVSRARKSLPTKSQRYAHVVRRLFVGTTPRRKAALQAEGIFQCRKKLELANTVSEAIKDSKDKISAELIHNMVKKLKSKCLLRCTCKSYQIDWGFMMRASCILEEGMNSRYRPRGKVLSRKIQESIEEFYKRPDISTELPHKKTVKKMKVTKVLTITLQAAWEAWKTELGFSVALSTFASKRPEHIRLVDSMPIKQCLCKYCANIELTLQVLNKLAKRLQSKTGMHTINGIAMRESATSVARSS